MPPGPGSLFTNGACILYICTKGAKCRRHTGRRRVLALMLMARRQTKNRTGLPRLADIPSHDALVSFACLACNTRGFVRVGLELLDAKAAFESAEWVCENCGFVHSRDSDLPFEHWPEELRDASRVATERFWKAFFLSATEHVESYWKQCKACGRILPFADFSRHKDWGPLERQMECRACKAVINAKLNPKRSKQQLHEASSRRRIADLLLEGENESIDIDDLFERFGGKCFKTGVDLDKADRGAWSIDHILPSRYLFPLTVSNAALLSRSANENKRDQWPSKFYKPSELKRLARITGADLTLLARPSPIVNPNIDVDACVERMLSVREGSDLAKRLAELKQLLVKYDLEDSLSDVNRRLLGIK